MSAAASAAHRMAAVQAVVVVVVLVVVMIRVDHHAAADADVEDRSLDDHGGRRSFDDDGRGRTLHDDGGGRTFDVDRRGGGDHDVFDAKAVAVEIVERLLKRSAHVVPLAGDARPAHLHPRGAGGVLVGDVRIGTFGPLHPDVVDALDLDGSALVVEIDLEAAESLGAAVPQARPIPRLPAVTRDVALVVADAVPAGEVLGILREAAGDLCAGVEVFDVFRGGAIPGGHRSLAFRLVYRDPRDLAGGEAKTLTDAEVDKRHEAAVAKANERLGAVLRS